MTTNERKMIATASDVSLDLYQTPIARLIEQLQQLQQQYGQNAKINFDSGYEELLIQVYYERLETDKEVQARIKHEQAKRARSKKEKEQQEELERKLLKKLLKKYGDQE